MCTALRCVNWLRLEDDSTDEGQCVFWYDDG
jgi:hypothetical protein